MPMLLERIQLIKLNLNMDYRVKGNLQISIFKYAYLEISL